MKVLRSPGSKKFPHLSPATADRRLEAVEWLMDNLDYTEEECSNLSLKEMEAMRQKHEEDNC